VHGREDAHRQLVRVLVRDALVHLEQVPVPLGDGLLAEALDRVGEVEVDAEAGVADPAPLVADRLGRAARDVARRQVAEARVAALEVVVALRLRDLRRRPLVARPGGTHTRPSLRSDSDMSVSLLWWCPVTGMHVGWICV
jgi:hypothetical protein